MNIQLLASDADLSAYDAWVKNHPQGSLWQSLEWKTYQEALGRQTRVYAAFNDREIVASALIIIDSTVGGFSTWDCPRGPLGTSNALMEKMTDDARLEKCMSLFLSPIHPLTTNTYHLTPSFRHEQPEATRILDLTLDNEALLAQMHQKGRYNIKVAQKNGVTVSQSDDIDAYIALAQKTAKRDGFTVPSKLQLKTFLNKIPGSFLLIAHANVTRNAEPENAETAIAGLLGTIWSGTGIYYYGASDHAHRALMAPYLLQWEAMKYCKEHGCERYDLLGIAPQPKNAERGTHERTNDHPWAGISAFKEKFGGTVVTYPPEQQIILWPMMHMLLRMKRKLFG